VYPVTDYEFESDSMRENADGYFLTVDGIRWYNDHYARTPADRDDWRYSPLRAADLSGLPPAFVVTAERDPLRDQGEAYAGRLRDAGVVAEGMRGDGLFHGCFGMHTFLEPARPIWDAAVRALRGAFGTGAGG
jgi:acetyl esterase